MPRLPTLSSRPRRVLYALCAALAAATGGAACADPTTAPARAHASAAGDATTGVASAPGETLASLRWVDVARGAITRNRPSQQAAFRAMAYLNVAQFVAVDGGMRQADASPSAAGRSHASPADVRGAVGGASFEVLGALFPADAPLFKALLAAEADSLDGEERAAFARGVVAGRAVGARAVARARTDGFDATWTGTVPVGPGYWFSSAVPPAPPALPLLGQMRPFHMTSGSQFRPAPPPAFGSPAFVAALAEVRRLADGRTAEQDSLARYWAAPNGGLIVGLWSGLIGDQIVRSGFDERAATRTLALANTAAMDALVACHDAKYTYWLLRPSQADPGITTAVGLPNFPAYPSNHACLSAAIADVLGAVFPAERGRFAELAAQAAESRVHGGIHYRFDSDTGMAVGSRVARLAVDAELRGGVRALLR